MAKYKTDITAEQALAKFAGGIDCSQVVFGEFAPQFGIDRETAEKISAGFGGGMFEGETCGAVTGALMALGLKYGHSGNVDPEKKNEMTAIVMEFKTRFAEEYGSCICSEMLGCKIPEEMEKVLAEKKFETVCCPAVLDACDIVADILNKE